jgi:hypothetical protein
VLGGIGHLLGRQGGKIRKKETNKTIKEENEDAIWSA